VCSAVDLQEILLCDSLFFGPRPLLLLLRPVELEWPEDNDIKTLIDVRGVCRIADDVNVMRARKVKEWLCIVRVVTIDGEHASPPIRFGFRLLIKVSDILQVYLAVDPALSGIAKSTQY
jgi:hypothetical protein